MSSSSLKPRYIEGVIQRIAFRLRLVWFFEWFSLSFLGYVVFKSLLVFKVVSPFFAGLLALVSVVFLSLILIRLGFKVTFPSRNKASEQIDKVLNLKERVGTLDYLNSKGLEENATIQSLLEKQILDGCPEDSERQIAPLRISRYALVIYFISITIFILLNILIEKARLVSPQQKIALVEIVEEIKEVAEDPKLSPELKESLLATADSIEGLSAGEVDLSTALENVEAAQELVSEAQEVKQEQIEGRSADRATPTPTPTPTATPTPPSQPSSEPKEESDKEDQSKEESSDKSDDKGSGDGESDQESSGESDKSKGDQGEKSGEQGKGSEGKEKQQGESSQGGGEKDSKEKGEEQGGGDSGKSQGGEQQGGQQDQKGGQEEGKQKGQGGEQDDSSKGDQPSKKDSKSGEQRAQSALSKAKDKLEEMQGADGDKGDGEGSGSSSPGDQSGPKPGDGANKSDKKIPGEGESESGKGEESKAGSAGEGSGKEEAKEEKQNPGKEGGKAGAAPGAQKTAKRFDEGGEGWEGLGGDKGFGNVEIKAEEKNVDPRFLSDGEKLGENKGPAQFKTELGDVKLSKPVVSKDAKGKIPLEYDRYIKK